MSDLERDSNYYLLKEDAVYAEQQDGDSTVLYTRASHKLHDPDVSYGLATVDYWKGDYHKAIKKYRLTLAIKRSSYRAYNVWGSCLSHLGRFDEAILKFKEALDINPRYGLSYLNWGLILYWKNEKDEAEKIVEEGLKKNTIDQERIMKAFKVELSLDEKRLEKANTEEEKESLKERITGYHWILELTEKFLKTERQNRLDHRLDAGDDEEWEW